MILINICKYLINKSKFNLVCELAMCSNETEKRKERIRQEIHFEHQIIVSRINILLTIQTIIFGAYVGLDTRVYNQQIVRGLVDLFPWMGLIFLFFLQLAICAGLGELRYLRKTLSSPTSRKKRVNKVADLAYAVIALIILFPLLFTLKLEWWINIIIIGLFICFSIWTFNSTRKD